MDDLLDNSPETNTVIGDCLERAMVACFGEQILDEREQLHKQEHEVSND